ncbi:MAG: GNAT family N-acetyltransferase [Acidobacteriota bacterium]
MDKNKDYQIIEYESRYFPSILELFSIVHEDYMDERLWKWKYFYPSRKPAQILMAVQQGKVVGIQPAFFNRMKMGNTERLACMLADVMTHPKHRRKGVFSALVEESKQKALEKGVPLIYTFPNEQSFPMFIRHLKWHHIFSLPLHIKITNMLRIVQEWKGPKSKSFALHALAPIQKLMFRQLTVQSKQYEIQEISQINEEDVSSLLEDSLSEFPFAVIRDRSYLEWRYIKHPRHTYRIFQACKDQKLVGLLIFRMGTFQNITICFLCDFFVDRNHQNGGLALLAEMEHIMSEERVGIAGSLMLSSKRESKILKRAGFRILPRRLAGKEFYLVSQSDDVSIKKNFLLNPQNWFMTWGDTDIV